MNLASPFSLALVAIMALAFLGLPIGHAMIAGSVLYLLLAGQDMGTAAEQLLNGMYSNYVILAVPLFILAAEFMNIGSMTDRLMMFCNALVGRFRGGLAQVNILQSIVFAGMSGSAIADAAGTGRMMQVMMTRGGRYSAELRGRGDGGLVGDRPDHPAVDPDDPLRARLRRLDRLPFPRRRHPGAADGARPDDHRRHHGAPEKLSRRGAGSAAEAAAHHVGGAPLPDDAGRSPGRHLRRLHHADGGRGRRGRLCARDLGTPLPQRELGRPLPVDRRQRTDVRLDRNAHRRRPRLQLRRHHREHP